MSTMEEGMVAQIAADAGVMAIIASTDVHTPVIPQGAGVPAIVYQLISGSETEVAEYWRPRYQLACWDDSYAGAVALANAVRSCFYNKHLTVSGVHFRSWIANVMDGNHEPEIKRYCRIVDVRFDHKNPT